MNILKKWWFWLIIVILLVIILLYPLNKCPIGPCENGISESFYKIPLIEYIINGFKCPSTPEVQCMS